MMKLLLLAGTAFVSGVACAQDARPIRMIVPFSGGSASDVITRIVIERISATTGQRRAATSAHNCWRRPRPMATPLA